MGSLPRRRATRSEVPEVSTGWRISSGMWLADDRDSTRRSLENGSPLAFPALNLSQGLVDLVDGGWRITEKGKADLEVMEMLPPLEVPLPTWNKPQHLN